MPWAIWIGKENLEGEPLAQRLALAISSPGSPITVLRSSVGTCWSFLVKPLSAFVALVPSILERIPRCVVRSSSVRMADHWGPL